MPVIQCIHLTASSDKGQILSCDLQSNWPKLRHVLCDSGVIIRVCEKVQSCETCVVCGGSTSKKYHFT